MSGSRDDTAFFQGTAVILIINNTEADGGNSRIDPNDSQTISHSSLILAYFYFPCKHKKKRRQAAGVSLLCSWMSVLIDIPYGGRYQLCIKQCGGDIRMTKHLLNRLQICAVFQQMSGEGMTQHVWCDILLDLSLVLVIFNDFPEPLT